MKSGKNWHSSPVLPFCLGIWSYVKKKYKLNVPNFHVPAGQVSLQEPQQILPLLSDILLRTD